MYIYIYIYVCIHTHNKTPDVLSDFSRLMRYMKRGSTVTHTKWHMEWLRLVGSLKLLVSLAKEPYKRDYILQKTPIILRSLLIVATPYIYAYVTEIRGN